MKELPRLKGNIIRRDGDLVEEIDACIPFKRYDHSQFLIPKLNFDSLNILEIHNYKIGFNYRTQFKIDRIGIDGTDKLIHFMLYNYDEVLSIYCLNKGLHTINPIVFFAGAMLSIEDKNDFMLKQNENFTLYLIGKLSWKFKKEEL